MAAEERAVRLVRLLEYLNDQERPVPVGELVLLADREFGVSEVTLRSDLAALCSLCGIRKRARGAYEAAREGTVPSLLAGSLFGTRLQRGAEAKFAIAGAVVRRLVQQEDLRVLLLDAGTTPYYVADVLSERDGLDLIVWTPNVAAAIQLAGARGISVRLLAGEYDRDYAAVGGDETVRTLLSLSGNCRDSGPTDPDAEPSSGAAAEAMLGKGPTSEPFPGTHCVLSINHISPEGGLFTDESRERSQKRVMARFATELTIVADRSKLFGRRLGLQAHELDSLSDLGGKRRIQLVTDAAVDAGQRELAQKMLRHAFPSSQVAVEDQPGAVVFVAES